MSELTCCLDCGMPVWPNEYHPFAACLMFRACQNTSVVRANLPDIRPAHATAAPVVVGEEMVERAAKALCITDDCTRRDWHEFPEYGRDRYRDKARAALTAALAGD